MSIANYGKKLVKDGVLICEAMLLHQHDLHKIWAPDFMESILFISSKKTNYQSVLHFFWQSMFHQREVMNQADAEEIFTSTHLYKVTLDEARKKIQRCCPDWYEENRKLIPNAKWTHIIWNDSADVFIVFEEDEMFYGWGWDCIE
ncbi:MAG: hypothetical protein JKY19_06725 [Alcanivoracaceae bacterium]|nr:hypothetical protein [Alcanivoracaceae bacterium]